MYTAVKGIYENGQIKLIEPAPATEKSAVIITFLGSTTDVQEEKAGQLRIPGFLKKWGEEHGFSFSIPEDFNAPLDDLEEYM